MISKINFFRSICLTEENLGSSVAADIAASIRALDNFYTANG